MGRLLLILVVLAGAAASCQGPSAELRVAVASNFAPCAEELGRAFTAVGGQRIRWSRGSTGKLFAQIVQGAPFDVFLAADAERPERLVREGLADAESRFTYARGNLVLWSPGRAADLRFLEEPDLRMALANPTVAPYGEAAREVLERLDVWEEGSPRFVRGEDVGQAFAFVSTGGADLGLVALASVRAAAVPEEEVALIPRHWLRPLEQQAVRLASSREPEGAAGFLAFLRSAEAAPILEGCGYQLPGE